MPETWMEVRHWNRLDPDPCSTSKHATVVSSSTERWRPEHFPATDSGELWIQMWEEKHRKVPMQNQICAAGPKTDFKGARWISENFPEQGTLMTRKLLGGKTLPLENLFSENCPPSG